MYDITNEKSFDNIKNWIRNIEEHASADVEKMILGNKCDMNDKRQVNNFHSPSQNYFFIVGINYYFFRFQKTVVSNLLLNTGSNLWKLVRKHQLM